MQDQLGCLEGVLRGRGSTHQGSVLATAPEPERSFSFSFSSSKAELWRSRRQFEGTVQSSISVTCAQHLQFVTLHGRVHRVPLSCLRAPIYIDVPA